MYSATKSGVDRLTRVAAMESGKLGYGVRVNCIYPGLVPTAMGAGLANDVARIGLFGSPAEAVDAVVALTPSGRLGEVAGMASAVVFLASDAHCLPWTITTPSRSPTCTPTPVRPPRSDILSTDIGTANRRTLSSRLVAIDQRHERTP